MKANSSGVLEDGKARAKPHSARTKKEKGGKDRRNSKTRPGVVYDQMEFGNAAGPTDYDNEPQDSVSSAYRKGVVAATGFVMVLTSALAVVTTYQSHNRPHTTSAVPEATPSSSAEMVAEMETMKEKMKKMTNHITFDRHAGMGSAPMSLETLTGTAESTTISSTTGCDGSVICGTTTGASAPASTSSQRGSGAATLDAQAASPSTTAEPTVTTDGIAPGVTAKSTATTDGIAPEVAEDEVDQESMNPLTVWKEKNQKSEKLWNKRNKGKSGTQPKSDEPDRNGPQEVAEE
eukprot:CAMPEP_0119502730 /NCGR_PEP_ID=MMETSP1344-20130328/24105_1 /TAXON_ID=236787 /ORGANISM="Florenciella parvula, Strain CCMP2471" /LENGTH=290 /DNA_ID=CAMNT_0007538961 /DNA_START=273 /DNA_END=1142 /DNA_ORIENTATION=+